MQVPQIYPVFVREASNSMYTVSAFFAAAQLVSFCTLFYYPMIITTCTFFNFGLTDHSLDNYLTYLGTMMLIAFCGSMFGYFVGTLVANEVQAVNVL